MSPSLKAYGIPGRARLFEVVQKVKEVNANRLREAVRLRKAVYTINKELRIYTGFINDTGKELPTIIVFEDILEIGVNMT